MSSFGAVAARSCASHEGLALALAADLGCDTAGAPDAVRRLAAALPRDPDPRAALEAVSDLCRHTLTVRAGGALLLPEVLRRGGGDPSGVAVVAAVAAQEAGYAVGLIGGHGRLLVAHHTSDEPLVVDPTEGLIDAHTLGFELHWRCAHESAADILERTGEQAERHGDLALATAARALALQLPLEDASRATAQAHHRRLLSRLN